MLAAGPLWHLLAEEPSRLAIETAEQFAEGTRSAEQLARARTDARQVTWDAIQRVRTEWSLPRINDQARVAWVAVWAACRRRGNRRGPHLERRSAATGLHELRFLPAAPHRPGGLLGVRTVAIELGLDQNKTTGEQEEAYQCDLLRDLFEDAVEPALLQPEWLEWRLIRAAPGPADAGRGPLR